LSSPGASDTSPGGGPEGRAARKRRWSRFSSPQIATLSLAARFHEVFRVAVGTTLGMVLANIPAVLVGEAAVKVAPVRLIRFASAGLFVVLRVWTVVAALKGG
jgi:putative Ca2+/H+ antiporter (TMEM165/GDT1 family)